MLKKDKKLIGCVALHIHKKTSLINMSNNLYDCGEVACLFIKKRYSGKGLGKLLVDKVKSEANKHHLQFLFAFSRNTFLQKKCGFKIANPSFFPKKRFNLWLKEGKKSLPLWY